MTRITANMILLIMAGVWAYLSIKGGLIQPVSDNFIKLGLLVAAGEIGAGVGLPEIVRKKIKPKEDPV